MSFDLYLYRAAEGSGPWSQWTEMHAQPLGTRAELQAAIAAVFPGLAWKEADDGVLASAAQVDDARLPRELRLTGTRDEVLLYVICYSGPPALRTLMQALQLNHCYAPESDELRDPFAAGDDW